ncbi:carbohydrate-binding module family 48 protein [Suhomyces tanzawaensis NRRL Y-17324]|uniref:Carbohydrate-binding module family 48 protein n=1 Tax=Suhomyces tanzawaensis NRRL Y-17324 TaxID=984487 RepID=A0A1E4SEB1_9ASCO|nr:carbohydrate-binding module family 48 protein [Suhomyces tanzawaensis NRRL Y-17324]ODV77859.1 carbohydrate-binding module family 48 protein [Suhomyces tanzawaensis NRRL Y-17324]
MSSYTFKWPKGPSDVILTGTFDNWSKSLPLVKQADGSSTQRIAQDDSGIDNNVLEPVDLEALSSTATTSKIPEAGGLAAAATTTNDVSTTVLPSAEGKGVSVAGEPGIFVPSSEEQLAAFANVEDVDSRNLSAAEKKKQKKKVKRSQYKAKKKKKAAEAAVGGAAIATATSTTTESTDTDPSDIEVAKDEVAKDEVVHADEDKNTIVNVPVDHPADAKPVLKEAPVDAKSDAEVLPVIDSTTDARTLDPREAEKEQQQHEDAKAAATAAVAAAIAAPVAAAVAVEASETKAAESTTIPEHRAAESVPEPVVAPVPDAIDTAKDSKPVEEPTAVIATELVPKTAGDIEPVPEAKVADPEPTIVDDVPGVTHSTTEAQEKEVDAAPVSKNAAPSAIGAAAASGVVAGAGDNESDEEILIAQGKGNTDDIEAAIVAREGNDVIVEEIKPTESEAARLTEEAHIKKPAAAAPAKKEKEAKKEKKSGRVSRFFKKIFT